MGSRIENEFVPYQQALALKELGFDEPCFGYWNIDPSLPTKYLNPRCEPFKHDWCLPAPTFSQAFRWFREKYNVHSSPKRYDETKWWVEWGTWTSPVFETFEKAELACLNKLIEIVKDEKHTHIT